MRNIDEEYYGYRDEDDGVILPLEVEAEKLGKFSSIITYKHFIYLTVCQMVSAKYVIES